MGDTLPRMLLNHRAKFDAANFIFAGEIREPNKQTKNKEKPIYSYLVYRHVWIIIRYFLLFSIVLLH